jgi:hypothetical protein
MSKPLNPKEQAVLDLLKRAFPEPLTLEEMARVAFAWKGSKPEAKGNSWVRNSLRFLRKERLVKRVAPGMYQACER